MPTFELTDLQQRSWDGLDGNNQLYPPANVTSVLNEGLRRLNIITAFNQATVPIGVAGGFTVANQQLYAVPAGLFIPQRVYFEQRELKKMTIEQIAQRFRDWTRDASVSKGPPMRWAPIGLNQFVIHPFDAVGGRLLEVSGVAPVTPLVNAGDVVELEDHNAEILIDYTKSRIMLKEGGKPFADASLAYQQMIAKLKTMVAWENMAWPRYFVQGASQ